jgi:hypothetical protein
MAHKYYCSLQMGQSNQPEHEEAITKVGKAIADRVNLRP